MGFNSSGSQARSASARARVDGWAVAPQVCFGRSLLPSCRSLSFEAQSARSQFRATYTHATPRLPPGLLRPLGRHLGGVEELHMAADRGAGEQDCDVHRLVRAREAPPPYAHAAVSGSAGVATRVGSALSTKST